jgi:hypothetical protein
MLPLEARLQAGLGERYTLVRELGRGGMARVYLAEDTRHHRQVALKLLNPELASAIGSGRFLREIEVAARLTHPHILPLFDSGDADGLLWYAMPYMPGQSLQDRIEQEGPLPVDEALPLAIQVAQALDYAHRQGVVHRDIKPSNILLHEGTALVADFGIALALSDVDTTRLTGTGTSLGTPLYMSPEQASGDQAVDGRTDLYALGCVIYEMLAGEPPFTGGSPAAVVARILMEEAPPLAVRRPEVPAHVARAVARALAKEPAERFASGKEMVAALQGERVSVAGARQRRRWPRAGALGLGAMGVLGIATGALAGLRVGPFARPMPAPLSLTRLTTTGAARSPAVSPDGEVVAYFANRCPNRPLECPWDLVWQDVAGGPPLKLLEDIAGDMLALSSMSARWGGGTARLRWLDRSTLLFPGKRTWTTQLVSRTGGAQRTLPGLMLGRGAGDTVFSTLGSDGLQGILVVSGRSGEAVDTIPGAAEPSSVEGSPDGRWLAMTFLPALGVLSQSSLLVITDRQGTVRDTLSRELFLRTEVRWSPTSDALYYWRSGSNPNESQLVYRRISRARGTARGKEVVLTDRAGLALAPSFDLSLDGRVLAVEAAASQDDYTVLTLSREGRVVGEPRVLRTLSQFVDYDLTPDGRLAIFYQVEGGRDSVAYHIQVSPIDSLALRAVGPKFFGSPNFWPAYDSRRMLVHYAEGERMRWATFDLYDGTLSPWREVPKASGTVVAVAEGALWLSDDGRELTLFDTAGTETPIPGWAALRTAGFANRPVSPDGRTVAIEAIPDSGRVSREAYLPMELILLSLPGLSLTRAARVDSAPFALDWGPRWVNGAPMVNSGLEAPRGARLWVPDGKGGIKLRTQLPPGFDYALSSTDGRLVFGAVTRVTSDILTARLEAPR